MDINNDNSGSTNNGGKGRFSERLKKIQRDKRKRVLNTTKKRGNRVIFKPFLIVSSFLYSAVSNDDKKHDKKNDVAQKKEKLMFTETKELSLQKNNNFDNVDLKNTDFGHSSVDTVFPKGVSDKTDIINNEKEVKIHKLQTEIIDMIKKRLVNNMNELEILQSELYILKEITGDDVYLTDCNKNIKEIKKMLSKIKTLKEKYNYLKQNVKFDSFLEVGDDSLIDKIIELKDLCYSDEVKHVVDNYKILEEYKSLYLKIDKLEENIEVYNKYKLEQAEELKKRDIDFEKLKEDVYFKQKEQEKYDRFVLEQELLMKQVDEKISKIDSKEVEIYKFKGLNLLIANSFKYLGLLLASPLKGILPGIVSETIITRYVIHNLYNNMEVEKTKKMVYETIDFSLTIKNAMKDLDNAYNMVNMTLFDIRELKEKYEKDFYKYESSFSEYSEIIRKLNKMEKAVSNNKIKIEIMKEKMKDRKKENDDKMIKVKKLNSSANN